MKTKGKNLVKLIRITRFVGVRKQLVIGLMVMLLQAMASLIMGCGNKNIEGIVKDPFGQGIKGVSVQIDKSTFAAITDPSGHYSIDFVPGTILLKYSKSGYYDASLELNLNQKIKFPAQPILMYPAPEKPGFYYLGEKSLIELPSAQVSKAKYAVNWMDQNHYKYYAFAATRLIVKPNGAEFLDGRPEPYYLVSLGPGSIIQEFSNMFGTIKYNYYGIVRDKQAKYLKLSEHACVSTYNLQNGQYYAWVSMVKTLGDQLIPNEKLPCYPFLADSNEAGEVVEMDTNRN